MDFVIKISISPERRLWTNLIWGDIVKQGLKNSPNEFAETADSDDLDWSSWLLQPRSMENERASHYFLAFSYNFTKHEEYNQSIQSISFW